MLGCSTRRSWRETSTARESKSEGPLLQRHKCFEEFQASWIKTEQLAPGCLFCMEMAVAGKETGKQEFLLLSLQSSLWSTAVRTCSRECGL